MSEVSEPSTTTPPEPDDSVLRRLLIIKSVLLIAGITASAFWADLQFTAGLAIGGILGYLNFYWLRSSLGRMLGRAADGTVDPPAIFVIKHNFRFFSIILIVIGLHVTGLVPLMAMICGLLFLALAIVIEGLIQIFLVLFRREEI